MMENPEEILHCLEEFSKLKPKSIPRELEEYLCFVAKTGNPVYQWPIIKNLFREKLLRVITEFYESCPSVEIPPCPNVEMFNYDLMKNFILEKLDTFAAAPFTVQRISELLTTPRKEYNRIDKYMRALEKNILVVSTTEPGRRSTENSDSIVNGLEPEHLAETSNSSHDINVEEMDESPSWSQKAQIGPIIFDSSCIENSTETQQLEQLSFQGDSEEQIHDISSSITITATKTEDEDSQENDIKIPCQNVDESQQPYVSIEPVDVSSCGINQEGIIEHENNHSLSVTTLLSGVQPSSFDKMEVLKSENGDDQNIKEISFIKVDTHDLIEEKDQIQPITDTAALHSSICQVPVDGKTDAEVEKKMDEITSPAKQSDIEVISPESSSLPVEALKDMCQDQYNNHLEAAENREENRQDLSQLECEDSENEDKWSNGPEEPKHLTCLLPNASYYQTVEDTMQKVSNDSHQYGPELPATALEISNSPKEHEAESKSCIEKENSELSECNEHEVQQVEPDQSDKQKICHKEAHMDIDVLNDQIKEQAHEIEKLSTTDTL